MAKCSKNCYHYDVCSGRFDCEYYGCECMDFKDKSLIVELPCGVGETIYAHGCPSEPIEAWTILYPSIAYEENGYIHHTPLNSVIHSIGKTVFLSREEAERALEEREKNG